MKNTYPTYYKKFACIADKCPDTCCAGWEIVVDGISAEKYNAVCGDFGDKLRRVLKTDEDGDRIFENINGRCPFLLENGLCEMYIRLGRESLCKTCENFPRHRVYFGARTETGISLSCPEAAEIILNDPASITFETEETSAPLVPSDFNAELYLLLMKAREKIFSIIQNRSRSVHERLIDVILLSDKLDRLIRKSEYEEAEEFIRSFCENEFEAVANAPRAKRAFSKYISDHLEAEALNGNWKSILSSAKLFSGTYPEEFEIEHLAVYFFFRYFITAAYDGDLIGKVKFCIQAIIVIESLSSGCTDKQARIRLMQRYSKETEHSAFNMALLRSKIRKSRFYSPENLINILSFKENSL